MAATVKNNARSQYVADTTSDLFIRDVSSFPDLVKRTDFPAFKSIKMGQPLGQPKLKLEWGVRHIPPVNDTTAAGFDNSTTTITPDNIGYYQVNHVILTPAGEKMWVTAVGASTLTVTRGAFGGTAGTIVAAGAGLRIIGIATKENAESPIGTYTQGEVDYNYYQIFDKMIQLSNRSRHTPTYEVKGDQLKASLQMIMEIEMPQYMEQTLLWGTRALGSTTSPSTMGGLFQTSYSSNSVDLAGDILTEYQFLEGLQEIYNLVGAANVGKTVMSHPFYKRIAANWNRDMIQIEHKEKTRDFRVDTYATDFGTVTWMMNHHMTSVTDPALPDGRMWVGDFDDLSFRPYSSDSNWAIYAVYEGGWYSRRAVRADLTLEALNPEKRTIFTNLSTTALDYPNFVTP